MERDCVASHGSSMVLKERLFEVSDKFKIPVCSNCNIVTNTTSECQICKGDNIQMCNFPYASKLFHQEITALGIDMSIIPKEQ